MADMRLPAADVVALPLEQVKWHGLIVAPKLIVMTPSKLASSNILLHFFVNAQ